MVVAFLLGLLLFVRRASAHIEKGKDRSWLPPRQRRLSACNLVRVNAEALNQIWDDGGSGADQDFSCWRPSSIAIGGQNFKPLGDVVHRSHAMLSAGQLLVAGDVKPPLGFLKVWDDSGSGARKDFSAWLPQDPPGYRCLGHVCSGNQGSPPPADLFSCIPDACIDTSGNLGEQIWNDAGSGAHQDFSAYGLPVGNGYFVSHASHSRSGVHTVHKMKIKEQCFTPRSAGCSGLQTLQTGTAPCAGCNLEWVRTFAPILFFDKRAASNCLPSNAGDHYDIRKSGLTERVCNTDSGSLERGEVETYFEYQECGNATVISYWWWYGWQNPCINHFVTEGAHPGDWERIVVLLVDGQLRHVKFYQHSGDYTVGNFFIYKDTHPVVYVGRIAHGSYHDLGGTDSSGLGFECMYFQDPRDPGDNPINLKTWSNLVYVDSANGPEWMSTAANTAYFEGVFPPNKRSINHCELKGCDGNDDYSGGYCLGKVCGCAKSCLSDAMPFVDLQGDACPIQPADCLTGMECVMNFKHMGRWGAVSKACQGSLTILAACLLHITS